jgi:hypothetical protein
MVIGELGMFKASMAILVLSLIVACGGTPPQMRVASPPHSIISEQPDPATAGVVVDIKVAGQPSQSDVKSIAESLIASRRSEYKMIVIRSFVDSATQGRMPYALSRLENGAITHQFNPQAEMQKIPTH